MLSDLDPVHMSNPQVTVVCYIRVESLVTP